MSQIKIPNEGQGSSGDLEGTAVRREGATSKDLGF